MTGEGIGYGGTFGGGALDRGVENRGQKNRWVEEQRARLELTVEL